MRRGRGVVRVKKTYQLPASLLESKLLVDVADLGQDAQLKARHRVEELWVVLRVDAVGEHGEASQLQREI